MKILKSILYTAFALLICAEIIYAQDFKIAPNTPVPEESNFCSVSITSDINNGFLVTWVNHYYVDSMATVDRFNYACRISKTGEILDSTAIDIGGNPVHGWECPNAVFVGGNWIIASQQDFMLEWIGAVRLTPSGELLDDPPVNICASTGMATILYPSLATNGQEILCVTGVTAEGLYGSIVDPDLNILVERFLILEANNPCTAYRACANGNNFFLTFLNWDDIKIKLVIINPEGQILSTQDVSEDRGYPWGYIGAPSITTLNDTTYITYFDASALWARRYSSDGNPIDSTAIKIFESQDFNLLLEEMNGGDMVLGYIDLVWANESFCFFWPRILENGISMLNFKHDLSLINNQPVHLNSQCQCKLHFGEFGYESSYSIIRSASIGNKVLTAWIDGREGNTRVYGNLFNVDEYTGIEQEENQIMIPEDFSISQNYPNPFNSSTTIQFDIREQATVKLFVYDITGRIICTLVNELRDAGCYTVHWDSMDFMGKPVASGVYLTRFEVITQDKKLYNKIRKMILIR